MSTTAAACRLSRLELDVSCANRANWRTSVEGGEARAEAVEKALEVGGWSARCRHAKLRVFRCPSGHEIAWVLSTGRLQIRVPVLIDPDERRASAQRVWRQLRRAFEE